MMAADVPFGMRLKEQAGWNQTEADWQRFLDLEPAGCFLAESDGTPVGTVTTCTFGPVAWIAMMLVDPALRGRGIGRALMMHALDYLEGQGVRGVRLDATPMGQPLYEKLGFAPQYTLTRYDGMLPCGKLGGSRARTPEPNQLEAVLQLDQEATGTDRAKLFRALVVHAPDSIRAVEESGAITGFLLTRAGTRARFVGPCVASGAAGSALFADLRGRHAGERVFVDVPDNNRAAVAEAVQLGLSPQRPLLRMARGSAPHDHSEILWASSGPEMG
jgi:GNAT superfamily N-acetyltransferase